MEEIELMQEFGERQRINKESGREAADFLWKVAFEG